jgi:hypothetical protein
MPQALHAHAQPVHQSMSSPASQPSVPRHGCCVPYLQAGAYSPFGAHAFAYSGTTAAHGAATWLASGQRDMGMQGSSNGGIMPHLRSFVPDMQQQHPRTQEPPPPGLDGAFVTAFPPVQQSDCGVVPLASAVATTAYADQRTCNLPLDKVIESGMCSVQFEGLTASQHLPVVQSSAMCKTMPPTLQAYAQPVHQSVPLPAPRASLSRHSCCSVPFLQAGAYSPFGAHAFARPGTVADNGAATCPAWPASRQDDTRNMPLDTVFESGLCSVEPAAIWGAPSGSVKSSGNVADLGIHNGPRSSQAIGTAAADTQLVHTTGTQIAHKRAPSVTLVDTRNGPAGHLVQNSLLICSHFDSDEDPIDSMFGDACLR